MAVNIGFESVPAQFISLGNGNYVGATYHEAGFTFSASNTDSYALADLSGYKPESSGHYISNDYGSNESIYLTHDNEITFGIKSIQIDNYFSGTSLITFTALLQTGATLYDTFNTDSSYGYQTLTLPSVFSSGITKLTLNVSGQFVVANFDNLVLNTPCYCARTLILTDHGEVAVEHLKAGDLVVTASGELRPIVWLGSRRLDLARHPRPELVRPVRIAAGALGEGLPRRDLCVSPEHALWLDDTLVPAKDLLNGVTLRQEAWSAVDYFHVELESHDILLAEGVPAESYLECDNRAGFDNAPGVLVMSHPGWSALATARLFAPPSLTARLRARFAAIARTQGHAAELDAYEARQLARGRVTRTNVVRNPRAEGSVPGLIGEGGRAPTHWWFDTPAGIEIEILGTGAENGLPFIDLRLVGRSPVTGHVCLYPEPGQAGAARRGQDWTISGFLRHVGGTFESIAVLNLYVDEYGEDGRYLGGQPYRQPQPSTDELRLQRVCATHRMTRPDVTGMTAYIQIEVGADTSIDVTLRVAGVQIEQGEYASDLMIPLPGEIRATTRQEPEAQDEMQLLQVA